MLFVLLGMDIGFQACSKRFIVVHMGSKVVLPAVLICIGSELFYRFLSADVGWKHAICIGSWLQVKVSRMCYDF